MRKVILKRGAMQRAYYGNVQRRSLFEQRLHLRAVFANYADVISPCLAVPFFLNVQRAEFAETVRREQHLVLGVISYHNLRPMHHGRENERKLMRAEGKAFAVGNGNLVFFRYGNVKKVRYHGEGFCVANYLGIGICGNKVCHVCRMIRLHMLHHKIVRLAPVQRFLHIGKPFFAEVRVHRIHNGYALIHNYI
ncbi:unknown [Clostridium sp. CAG:226]|nr:unknown [Clostridium sp. CAG:226]